MPFEVECLTVPHLKALTRGIDHTSGHGHGSTFTLQKKNSLKSTHFASQTGQTTVSFDCICILRSAWKTFDPQFDPLRRV